MYIGVDAGTSVVKVVAFDQFGMALASSSFATTTYSPQAGQAEQNIQEITDSLGRLIRRICLEAGQKVDLLAITAQGDGLWLLDDAGDAVRPGILWSDGRAAPIVEHWQKSGISDRAYRRNGNVPFSGSAAAILTYLQAHEPDLLAKAITAGYCKDAIFQKLTGARVTDSSDASLPFLDLKSRSYDPDLLSLFGLDSISGLLAPVTPSRGMTQALSVSGANLTGLPEGTPVHCGPFDFPATTIGAGVTETGDGLIALGTTLACGVISNQIDTSGTPCGMTLCLPDDEKWIRLLPAMAGTLALDWILPLLSSAHEELDLMLSLSNPGAGGVQMLPFVATSGERAPFVDPGARGRLIGLSLNTTKADIARAACEGIAYAARHCLESAGLSPDGHLTICGGGSRTGQFRQIFADVLDMPIRVARQPETGARGAVISALQSSGIPFDFENWTAAEEFLLPAAEPSLLYQRGYEDYLEEIAHARGRWSGPGN